MYMSECFSFFKKKKSLDIIKYIVWTYCSLSQLFQSGHFWISESACYYWVEPNKLPQGNKDSGIHEIINNSERKKIYEMWLIDFPFS